MKAPAGLLGAALALWGFCNGIAIVGIALGVLLEALRFAPPWTAPASRVLTVVRVVVFLALAKLAYVVAASAFPQALYTWLRWLPAILLPLPMVQLLGARIARVNDVTYAYFVVILIGAGTGNAVAQWFYPVAALLVAIAIVSRVPRRRWPASAALLVAGLAIGIGTHIGLSELQGKVEDWSTDMLQDYLAAKPDALRERTRIGEMGRIKLSDRILMRVIPEGKRPASLLLREAVFDSYYNGEWRSSQRAFKPVPRDGERWRLRDGAAAAMVTLRRTLFGGEGLLALPPGAKLLERITAESLEALPTGTVRGRGLPRFLAIGVAYDEAAESEPPLGAGDLAVPDTLVPVLDQVFAAGGLKGSSERETLAAIQRYFADKFSYSLALADPNDGRTRTIVDFLLRDHKGHCEYFATGTVLLLRRAGIPARYTVGYSAQEYSEFEHAFIVRNRHAHAWTSAWIDGRWTTVDTTPSRWAENEGAEARGFFGPMLDFFSWALDRLVAAWLDRTAAELVLELAIVAFALALIPVGLVAGKRWRLASKRARPAPANPVTTAWLALEKRLAEQGFAREQGETALAWARRLRRENQFEHWRGELVDLARAYYRARFDPAAQLVDIEEFIHSARRWRNE